jgi:hypothetical protein
MRPDADLHPSDHDAAVDRSPSIRDNKLPVTSLDLCGLGMVLVGGGIPFAVAGWSRLVLLLILILVLILFMGIVQERWLTRERHRLVVSALKRTGALDTSREPEKRVPKRARTRRGGKPIEKKPSRKSADR